MHQYLLVTAIVIGICGGHDRDQIDERLHLNVVEAIVENS
jgi:hypothetical protein